MIVWSDLYNVNVPMIDKQHKELVKKMNDFSKACKEGNTNAVIDTLRFTKEYTVKHFREEEALMKKNNYPALNSHKKLHDDFIKQIVDLENKYKGTGYSLSLALNISNLLTSWLVNHIAKVDKEFAKFVNK